MTDGKAERQLREAIREAQGKVRAAADALWLGAFSGRESYEDAERRLQRASEAFMTAIGTPADVEVGAA